MKNIPKGNDDFSLIRDFLSGDKSAFDRLVVKNQDAVFNVCLKILSDYDEAADIAQETFIRVYKNLGKFKFESEFTTWIYRIAVNLCKTRISSLRYRIMKKSLRFKTNVNNDTNCEEIEILDNDNNPENIYSRNEMKQRIDEALAILPPDEKILITLRDIEGKSYELISEITGIKMGTVKSKISRGRQVLRDNLRGVFSHEMQ